MKLVAVALCLAAEPSFALAQDGQPGAHFIENWDLNADGIVTLAELQEKRRRVLHLRLE